MKKPVLMAVSALFLALTVSPVGIQSAQAAELKVYSVTGTDGINLNMRSGPGTNNSIVTKIPPNSTGVVATGEERKVGTSTWAKVYWAGKGGWVNKAYLTLANLKPPAGGTPPASGGGITMKCSGTEPFWGVTITETQMSVDMMDGPKYNVPVTFRQTSANNATIAVIAGTDGPNETQTFLQKVSACSDGMSDTRYPYAVTAVLNKRKVVSGCCSVR
ncbi:MAG: SH3 domain-containing protein [Candidatus Thiothrix moscowensis]|nr:SH3 domain-containing protein [Candidatus Thiothrix moscowensis]